MPPIVAVNLIKLFSRHIMPQLHYNHPVELGPSSRNIFIIRRGMKYCSWSTTNTRFSDDRHKFRKGTQTPSSGSYFASCG